MLTHTCLGCPWPLLWLSRICNGRLSSRPFYAGAHQRGIVFEYNRLLQNGQLQPDSRQLAAVQALQLLQDSLLVQNKRARTASPDTKQPQQSVPQASASASRPAASELFGSTGANSTVVGSRGTQVEGVERSYRADGTAAQPVVQGAYLWGPVGSGKTMLMDMFIHTLPTIHSINSYSRTATVWSSNQSQCPHSAATKGNKSADGWVNVLRMHSHQFMLEVHGKLHQLQQSLPRVVTRSRSGLPIYRHAAPPEDPVVTVARDTVQCLHLFCLDELHVTDVADAMLLSRLFSEVLQRGCMVVFTSNRPARDLYNLGLSRKYCEPFVRLVHERLLQLKVAGGRDYRMQLKQSVQQQQEELEMQNSQHQQESAEQSQGSGATAVAAQPSTGVWFVGIGADSQLQQQWQQLKQRLAKQHVSVATWHHKGNAPSDVNKQGVFGSGLDHGQNVTSSSVPEARQDADCDAAVEGPAQLQLLFRRSLWVPRAVKLSHNPWVAHLPQQPQGQQQDTSSQLQQQQQPLLAAFWTFEQLCGKQGSRKSTKQAGALSANDYIAVVRSCPAIFLEGVPQLQPSQRDEARRFVTLIDLVYEAHTAQPGSISMFVSAQVPPPQLFLPLLSAAAQQGINPNLGRSSNKLDVRQLIQTYGGEQVAATNGTAGSRHTATVAAAPVPVAAAAQLDAIDGAVPLLAEEVLMYHRASSRLAELCRVAGTGTQAITS